MDALVEPEFEVDVFAPLVLLPTTNTIVTTMTQINTTKIPKIQHVRLLKAITFVWRALEVLGFRFDLEFFVGGCLLARNKDELM